MDARSVSDRRRQAVVWSGRHWLVGGRRRTVRRTHDHSKAYVDWYPPQLLFVTLGIFALSALDATFTLRLLQLGAVEVNPFMESLLNRDIQLFVNIKVATTAICLVLLVVYSNFPLFKWLKVRQIINGLFAIYVVVIGYELVLLRLATA